MVSELQHGGDLDAADRRYGKPTNGWLDLSTGINPIPYPVQDIPSADWHRLPSANDTATLEDTFRTYLGPEPSFDVVAAPGTQVLIQWLPKLRDLCRVDVVGPTYNEHAASWKNSGHNVREIKDPETSNADVLVVVNPNNPTGRTFSPDDLFALASRQQSRGGWLVIDEAFADIDPSISVAQLPVQPGMVVLRSFGKFFGLAGVRLGFAFGDPTIVSAVRSVLGPWAVAGPALRIGIRAYADIQWQTATRSRLHDDADRLDTLLREHGLDPIGGTSLFRLVKTDNAINIADQLGHAGVLVRSFDYCPQWLRFGLPGSEDDWQRLRGALPITSRV